MIDTGADVSIFKFDELDTKLKINESSKISITGIGEGNVHSLGKITAELFIENIALRHDFHIVPSNFQIPCDAILGLDFIKKFNCVLDYNKNKDYLLIRPDNFPENIGVPLLQAPHDNWLTLPARSEALRKVTFSSKDEFILVPNQQIAENIFIAQTIVSRNNPNVMILNNQTNDVLLRNVKIRTESLENYDIFEVNCETKKGTHDSQILQKLQKNFPKFIEHEMSTLCQKYTDIFALETDMITSNNFYEQKLRLKDPTPVFIKNYKLPHSQKPEMARQVQKLLDDDIIEPSQSEYNSPLLLVPKKSLPHDTEKRWRLVIDYRRVNDKLVADKFPLPRIDDILDNLGKAKYFSCLDLVSGFHQVPLHPESRDITSFSTDNGSYRFKRLPFGLKIAPNSFQRMMNLAFSGLTPEKAFIYMDDLVIIAPSEKRMLKNLEEVFNICRKFNLKLHPDKCSFFQHEVTYLGHKCTDEGILPDDSKFSVIENYPKPTNADAARRFVAFCNYYRRFIKNFAHHASHITRLTKKNVHFQWTPACEEAFQYLKTSLLKPPILKYPDFTKQFCITTDASKDAIGAILSQEYNGMQLPIAYASRSLTRGEQNKSTIEKELAAIHWALNYFKPYVYGTKFLVKSDHKPLTYLFAMKNPSSKLTRMRLDLEEFDFSVEFIKGKNNTGADALSRLEFENIKTIRKVTTRSNTKPKQNDKPGVATNELKEMDPKIYEISNMKQVKTLPKLKFYFENEPRCEIIKRKKTIVKILLKHYFTAKDGLGIAQVPTRPRQVGRNDNKNTCVIDENINENVINEIPINNNMLDIEQVLLRIEKDTGKIYEKQLQLSLNDELFKYIKVNQFKEMATKFLKKLSIALTPMIVTIYDETEKNELLKIYHDDPILGGHPGSKRLLDKLRLKYYWKYINKDVAKYVKNCDKCMKNKTRVNPVEKLILTDTPQKAFDVVQIDTIGPFPMSNKGNQYAITMICTLTKYLISVPIPNKQAKTIAKAIFEHFILIYGPMKTIVTDKGTEYLNDVIKELLLLLKVEHKSSTAFHHQTLGVCERTHRTFNEYVRSYVNDSKTDWDDWLLYFTYNFNTTPSTVHGFCPFELIFGKLPPNIDFLTEKQRIDPLYNVESYQKEVKFRLQTANELAQKLLEKSKAAVKTLIDKNAKPQELDVGDLVLLRREERHKLDPLFKGPYKIINIEHPNVTLEDNTNKKSIVYKNRLRKFQKVFYHRFLYKI